MTMCGIKIFQQIHNDIGIFFLVQQGKGELDIA